MTPEEIEDFRTYGCTSRCIIFLANKLNISITITDFLMAYAHLFKFDDGKKKKRCGLINRKDAIFICKDLGIASNITEIYIFENIPKVNLNGILVFTKKKPEQNGTWSDYNHCAILDLNDLHQNKLTYVQVDQELQTDSQTLPESYFALFLPTFFVLFP